MLDHVSFAVSDIDKARTFYDAVLAPLGYARLMNFADEGKVFSGYGPKDRPQFWIYGGYGKVMPGTGVHLAFEAPTRAAVDAFHREALARGARDEGRPDLRPECHANYYGAFVFDPDGHKLEACSHRPGQFEDQFKS